MSTEKCPDCEGPLTPIRLIDKAYRPMHGKMEYAAGDAKPGMWLGRYPIEGQIEGRLCGECGRILLYAKPKGE
jgi:hypothetical protein